MYRAGDSVRAEDGTFYHVEDVFPYEPANYVNEDYVLLCHTALQRNTRPDEEYPLYSLGASGMVEVKHSENGRWETIGKWDPDEPLFNRLHKCPRCRADMHYRGSYSAPGKGDSYECERGHHWAKVGPSFYDPAEQAHIMEPWEAI